MCTNTLIHLIYSTKLNSSLLIGLCCFFAFIFISTLLKWRLDYWIVFNEVETKTITCVFSSTKLNWRVYLSVESNGIEQVIISLSWTILLVVFNRSIYWTGWREFIEPLIQRSIFVIRLCRITKGDQSNSMIQRSQLRSK